MAALAQAGVGAEERNRHCADGQASERSAPAQVWRGDLLLLAEEAELQAVVRAGAYAVHAHQALGLAPRRAADGIVAALAVEQTSVAVVAGGRVLVQPQHTPAGDRA